MALGCSSSDEVEAMAKQLAAVLNDDTSSISVSWARLAALPPCAA